jgi:hypothetical protein
MNVTADLVFPASIDLSGLDRDLQTAESMVAGFADSATSRLNLSSPSLKMGPGDSGGGASSAGLMAASIGVAAGSIRGALGSAVVPLVAFAAEFRTNFNEVGAIVEKLAIRIDSAMRFPGFMARIETFRHVFRAAFFVNFAETRKEIEHFDAKAAFAPFLAGLDSVVGQIQAKLDAMTAAVAAAPSKARGRGNVRGSGIKQTRNAKGQYGPMASVAAPSAQASAAPAAAALNGLKVATTDGERLRNVIVGTGKIYMDVSRILDHIVTGSVRGWGIIADKVMGAGKQVFRFANFLGTVGSVGGASFAKLGKINLTSGIGGMKALGQATGFATSMAKGLGFAMTMGLGPIGLILSAVRGVTSFFTGGAKGASDLNETVSKTNVIFGSATGSVTTFADKMSTDFGMVKGVTLDTASAMGGLGKSLGGLRGEKLGNFANQFTKMSADLSSFSNIDVSEAAGAIQSGLAGNQSDVLRGLGVDLSEDAVKAKAAALGIAKFGEELNSQQKFAARSALITQGLSKVNGDLERTQGGAANQGRKLMGSIANIGTTIGSIFLPVITEGITLLNEFGGWLMSTFKNSEGTIESWKETFLGAFDWVVATVHNFPSAFTVARLKIVEVLSNIGEWIAVLGPNAVMVAGYIGRNWLLLIGDAFDATVTGLKNLWTNFQSVGNAIGEWFADPTGGFHVDWTPLLTGFQATAEKFPSLIKPVLTDLSKEIAAAGAPIFDEVAARRAARAAAKGIGAPVIADDALDPLGTKAKKEKKGPQEKTLGGALELGSKEAYSSIVNATAGRSNSQEKAARDTAGNTAELVRLQRNAEKRVDRNKPGRLVIN